jgi:catechol 2,3-dioxygenase-like lactoylglutathione lyase family enzyme
MFDHLGIHAADVPAAEQWYLTVLGPIGLTEVMRFDGPDGTAMAVGLGYPNRPFFWLSPVLEGEGPAREDHIAFMAKSRADVDAVHGAAVEAGAEVLHEPREWPEYHPGYYAVFLRDLDGHNVEAVVHGDSTDAPA